MGMVLSGKEVAADIKQKVGQQCDELKQKGFLPTLCIIRVGSRPDDIAYEKGIIKACREVGAEVSVVEMPTDIEMQGFMEVLDKANNDAAIHGILIFRPLPKQLDIEEISGRINPAKDIDCMSPINLSKIFEGKLDGFIPCTAKAAMEILEYNKVELAGKNVAVAGRSMVIGKPVAMLLLGKDATVTMCHSRTKDIESVTSKADILVAAVGKAKFFKGGAVKENAVVIDVGINVDEEGKLCGDVDFEGTVDKAGMITPVPGGVGSVTSSILAKQLLMAAENQIYKK